MQGLHSVSKGEREVIRQLVHSVLVRDMSTFNPERFKEWVKTMDSNFRKVGLSLVFRIHDRQVYFSVRMIRGGRVVYKFASSTHVVFDDIDVVSVAPIVGFS